MAQYIYNKSKESDRYEVELRRKHRQELLDELIAEARKEFNSLSGPSSSVLGIGLVHTEKWLQSRKESEE